MVSVTARRLEGKVAIVTAATKGIGFAIAERLGCEGASVVISSRNEKNVQESVAQLRSLGCQKVEGIVCHVGKMSDLEKLVEFTLSKFGRIDILINNHGISPSFGHIMDVEDGVWNKLFDVNVKSGWQLAKLVHPHMKKAGGGNIIFNSSYGAYKTPEGGIALYAVTKTALLGLTKALALGLAADHIRVNAIAPGIIKTKLSQMLWEDGEQDAVETQATENQRKQASNERTVWPNNEIPLNRLGVPSECAGAVAFLVSEDASYITGETIVINGGSHARL